MGIEGPLKAGRFEFAHRFGVSPCLAVLFSFE